MHINNSKNVIIHDKHPLFHYVPWNKLNQKYSLYTSAEGIFGCKLSDELIVNSKYKRIVYV